MTSLKRPKPGILQLFVAPERGEPIGIIPENIAAALRSGGEIEQGSVGVEDAGLDSSERVLGHVPSSRFSAMIGCRELGGSSLVNLNAVQLCSTSVSWGVTFSLAAAKSMSGELDRSAWRALARHRELCWPRPIPRPVPSPRADRKRIDQIWRGAASQARESASTRYAPSATLSLALTVQSG